MRSPNLRFAIGAIAQLVERVLCKHEVVGSIPSGSTIPVSRLERRSRPIAHEEKNRFRTWPNRPGVIDIVKEGSSRRSPVVLGPILKNDII